MSTPLVSVVIAAWNAADFLPDTLATAVGQTWPDLEIIVVDDGSTDGTREAIAAFLPQIRYERRPHLGLAAARNEGIRLANGEYIALLDADDLWHPEKVATQVDIARRHPGTGLVACNGTEFDGDRILRQDLLSRSLRLALDAAPSGEVTGDFHRELIAGNIISCPSQVLLPRPVLDATGAFVGSGAQDYDYYLRVSHRFPITVHQHRHVGWRYHAGSMSGPHEQRAHRWGLQSLPALKAHRAMCGPEFRELLTSRIRSVVQTASYSLMVQGRESGRLAATRQLLSLLGEPGRLLAMKHLAGLWTPQALYEGLGRLIRRTRHG